MTNKQFLLVVLPTRDFDLGNAFRVLLGQLTAAVVVAVAAAFADADADDLLSAKTGELQRQFH